MVEMLNSSMLGNIQHDSDDTEVTEILPVHPRHIKIEEDAELNDSGCLSPSMHTAAATLQQFPTLGDFNGTGTPHARLQQQQECMLAMVQHGRQRQQQKQDSEQKPKVKHQQQQQQQQLESACTQPLAEIPLTYGASNIEQPNEDVKAQDSLSTTAALIMAAAAVVQQEQLEQEQQQDKTPEEINTPTPRRSKSSQARVSGDKWVPTSGVTANGSPLSGRKATAAAAAAKKADVPPEKMVHKRRCMHRESEQKRRDNIREKVEVLKALVPSCRSTPEASISVVLQRTIDYIREVQMSSDHNVTMSPKSAATTGTSIILTPTGSPAFHVVDNSSFSMNDDVGGDSNVGNSSKKRRNSFRS